jgi:hypothetical protein
MARPHESISGLGVVDFLETDGLIISALQHFDSSRKGIS